MRACSCSCVFVCVCQTHLPGAHGEFGLSFSGPGEQGFPLHLTELGLQQVFLELTQWRVPCGAFASALLCPVPVEGESGIRTPRVAADRVRGRGGAPAGWPDAAGPDTRPVLEGPRMQGTCRPPRSCLALPLPCPFHTFPWGSPSLHSHSSGNRCPVGIPQSRRAPGPRAAPLYSLCQGFSLL